LTWNKRRGEMEKRYETYQSLRGTRKVITGKAIILDRNITVHYTVIIEKTDYLKCRRRFNVETVELNVAQLARRACGPKPHPYSRFSLGVLMGVSYNKKWHKY
jgi:hypothetical protein